jgi:hypothetical protein
MTSSQVNSRGVSNSRDRNNNEGQSILQRVIQRNALNQNDAEMAASDVN